jgi:hypothetical protein
MKPQRRLSMDKEIAKAVTETMVDQKKGLRTRETAAKEIAKLTGLTPDIAKLLMQGNSGKTATQIRGYEKTPPQFIKERNARLGREPMK